MIPQKVVQLLEKNKIKYEPIKHRIVYTAYDKAATLKAKLNIIGKTLVLKADGDLAIILIPGSKNLDKNKLKKTLNDWRKKRGEKLAKNIDFISERIMKNKFKGIKLGAIPPLGVLWPARQRVRPACQCLALAGRSQAKSGGKLPTFTDRGLMKNPKIIINSGDYQWSIKINPSSFKKLIPDLIIGNFTKAKK